MPICLLWHLESDSEWWDKCCDKARKKVLICLFGGVEANKYIKNKIIQCIQHIEG